jgi:hypothetical protein
MPIHPYSPHLTPIVAAWAGANALQLTRYACG